MRMRGIKAVDGVMVVMALQTLVAFILDGERVFDTNMDFHQKPKKKKGFLALVEELP